jgi:hypothetical protein
VLLQARKQPDFLFNQLLRRCSWSGEYTWNIVSEILLLLFIDESIGKGRNKLGAYIHLCDADGENPILKVFMDYSFLNGIIMNVSSSVFS